MKFLSNAPLGDDLFEGKSQNSIAEAIVEQLEANAAKDHRSQQLKMIGVEGSWGSGKSNLIKIIGNRLEEKTGKYYLFPYDVWGHQEDLQRKAILNELVDFLIEKKAIENNKKENHPKNWKERVKKVTGTVTETTQFQVPQISWGIFFCALILLIIPFCNQVAELDVVKDQQIPFIPIHCPLPVGIVLFPLVLLFLLFLFFIDCKCRLKNKFRPSREIINDASAEALSIYKDKKIATTDRTYVNEMNPSVMDFRNLLKALSKELGNQHLVIFFDNMDRLPKEKVENLWSSIHTFFAENQGYINISCIVSFDRTHVKNAFQTEDEDEQRGDDYIDKTFDIVYRVASPVLSDWKNFFEAKWKEAFEDCFNQVEYDFVIQAYGVLSGKKGLTPRFIIKFINDCVLLKRLFKTIPERYIAIFNLRKKELIENSLDKECLGKLRPIYENEAGYDSYIAALVYQVPPEKAVSVIYVNSLMKALDDEDEQELNRISKASFFNAILEDALDSVASLPNAILSLDKIQTIPLMETRQKKLWMDLYSKSQNLMKFDSGKMEPFQNVLLKHLEGVLKFDLAKKILMPYNNVDFSKREKRYESTGKEYSAETYVVLLKQIEENIHRDELKGILHKIPIDPETYVSLLKSFDDFDWIPFKCDKLGNYVDRQGYREIYELEYLEKLPKEMKVNLRINGLEYVFARSDSYDEENFKKIVKIMDSALKSELESDWLNWALMARLFTSTQNSDLKGVLLAFRLMFYNHHLPEDNPFDAMLKISIPDEISASMFEFYLSRYGYGSLISNIPLLESCPTIRKRIQRFIRNEKFVITLQDVCNILPQLGALYKTKRKELRLLWSKISDFYLSNEEKVKKRFEMLTDPIWDGEEIEKMLPYDTINVIESQKTKFTEMLEKCLISYFNTWDKEMWVDAFKDVNLYGAKQAILIKYEWSQNAKEAIEECLNEELYDYVYLLDKEVWNQIMDSLDNSFKVRIFKKMRDEFYHGSVEMNEDLFIVVGDWLFEYGEIKQIAGDVLRTIVPISLLDNYEVARIIAKHIDVIQDVLDEENEAKDWLEKAKLLSKTEENYPLKELVKLFNLKS